MDLAITFIIMGILVIMAWIGTDIYLKHQEKNLENTALQ